MVLLIGNYAADRQQSMQRFSTMMLQGLTAAGVPAELIAPEPVLGKLRFFGGLVAKWLGYFDKFVLFPRRLRSRLKRGVSVVHICDHSNAMYAAHCGATPVVTTCHDLLAVRGALGEATDCPASTTGRFLQRWILRGLGRSNAIACVSEATRGDAERLLTSNDRPLLEVIMLGLSFPYRKLTDAEMRSRLARLAALDPDRPFILSVGSNLRRKNRDGVLRIFAMTRKRWNGQLVFAGEGMTPELRLLSQQLGISDRIVEVIGPENDLLEALYNGATALLYPSRFEGFGWPIAEAQACGCPVICADRPPLPEVAGDAALLRKVEDEEGFAADILRLADTDERELWSARSLRSAERFSTAGMISQYLELYRSLGAEDR